MGRLLVVEDSPSQARLIQAMLEQAGHSVRLASDGAEGLAVMDDVVPQLVLTDLQMPKMDGLQLVDTMRRVHPGIPIVLMTAFGSDDIAVEALKRGAASYVPKKRLAADLIRTVHDLLAIAQADPTDRLIPCLAGCEATFVLNNDASLIPALTGYVVNMLAQLHQWGENTLLRLAIALHEAVVNAICHGNLEVGSEHREGDGTQFDSLLEQRRRLAPYAQRNVAISARVSRFEVVLSVRDEGPGFDPTLVADPTDSANLEKLSGRGLFLIHTFLDEVRHNSRGNEITMVKRRELATCTSPID